MTETTGAESGSSVPADEAAFSLTRPSPWTRAWLARNLPLKRLLPDAEPAYVSSLLYTMGVLTLAALIVTVLSGVFLALGGVQWWHTNRLGAFMNSVHFWGVEAFFLFMAVHALFNFFTMAWRGGRGFTWVTGVLAFLLGVVTSFTGFLMMTNWDSQFIGQQAKDAFNALGIGALWNVMDPGQQFTMHVVVTAGLLGLVVLLHLGQIRRRGVAPPPGAEHLEIAVSATATATATAWAVPAARTAEAVPPAGPERPPGSPVSATKG
ncbi:MAG: cytochrome b N-terminal domain-containing protein, partial [Acidimicrobiales bacterium]